MAQSNDVGIVTEARRLAKVATDNKLKLPGGLDAAGMTTEADKAQKQLDELDALNRKRKQLVTDKNAAVKALKVLIKRLRTGVKAEYGDDSTEYEKVGGKRSSERKAPVRKPKVA